MSEIVLTQENHEYTVDGFVVISVTQILRDLGFIDFTMVDPFVLRDAQARGKAVHSAIDLLEENDLDWKKLHPLIRPFVDAYAEMKEQTGWKPAMREQKVFDPICNYAGQLDGFGSMEKLGLEEVLPDYKSGIRQSAARYQTGGYAGAINKPLAKRCSIHLHGNGKFSIDWYNKPENRNDVRAFRAIASVFHLKHPNYGGRENGTGNHDGR
jgi:hypothetical protein